ncbi:YlbF family regulator [Alicyclobacillus sp. ALC3]|uniref:YlbF family regulator n=1 Tax=Alicyclobacillus sp. ALC3 TaxID=2796143 RepID=UPI0023781974|nr:YlbF family regulator [Alicyclobacillus sp. ALC3]WDL97305.1 YlbF family regulator [Alicyclobacillus sp. ALC3]
MMQNVLEEKAARIATQIARSDAAHRYWQARDKMERNQRAQALFEELKLKTNAQMVLEERFDSLHPKVETARKDVQDVEQKMGEIPVALQYLEAKDELNEMVQGVMQLLLTRLTDQVPVELGPRQGCGNGHGGNGCDCGK